MIDQTENYQRPLRRSVSLYLPPADIMLDKTLKFIGISFLWYLKDWQKIVFDVIKSWLNVYVICVCVCGGGGICDFLHVGRYNDKQSVDIFQILKL